MLKMGLPMGAVKNAVQRDGKDPSMMDLDPNKSIMSQTGGGVDNGEEDKDTGVPLKDDPDFSKVRRSILVALCCLRSSTHCQMLRSTSKC
jgi:hypothetical protein